MNNTSVIVVLVLAFAVLAGGWYALNNIMVSSDQMRQAERACLRWFKDERDLGGYDAFKSDSWAKDGRAVVEVGFDRRASSYSTRLCIYDFSDNSMSAPNNFTRGRWEK